MKHLTFKQKQAVQLASTLIAGGAFAATLAYFVSTLMCIIICK